MHCKQNRHKSVHTILQYASSLWVTSLRYTDHNDSASKLMLSIKMDMLFYLLLGITSAYLNGGEINRQCE